MPLAWGDNFEIKRVIMTNGDAQNESGGWLGLWSTNCSVPEPISGNHYTVTAPAGETVYFTAGTNSGYMVLTENVSAKKSNGENVKLTFESSDAAGTKFSFTMPASEVTITANFVDYAPDVYFLAGDLNNWANGTKMTYDSDAKKYRLCVSFADVEYGFFRFRAGDNSYASGASGDYWPISENNAGESHFGDEITMFKGSEKRFRVPAGIYDIEVGQVFTDNWWSQTTVKVTKVESKSLADIEKSVDGGVVGKPYTVSNGLQVVAISYGESVAFARDLTTTTITCPEGKVDFMREVVTTPADLQAGPWQQNNWVMLDFKSLTADAFKALLKDKENYIIQAGTLTGVYTDNNNYTLKVTSTPTLAACGEGEEYTPNVYCPANFYSDIQSIDVTTDEGTVTKYYWFMTPKPMEVCKFTFAMYYAGNYDNHTYAPGFYMKNGDDDALKGGVGIDMSYNSGGNPGLTNGESYRFTGVIMKTGSGAKAVDPSNFHPQDPAFNAGYKVAATDLTKGEGQVITGVSEVKTGSDVVSVTYCDLAGRMSQKPFAGVNIIVTRYSDGTVKTTKAIK